MINGGSGVSLPNGPYTIAEDQGHHEQQAAEQHWVVDVAGIGSRFLMIAVDCAFPRHNRLSMRKITHVEDSFSARHVDIVLLLPNVTHCKLRTNSAAVAITAIMRL